MLRINTLVCKSRFTRMSLKTMDSKLAVTTFSLSKIKGKPHRKEFISKIVRMNAKFTTSGMMQKNIQSVNTDTEGRKLLINWTDKTTSVFHAQWLRINCRCPICYDHESGSFQFPIKDIPLHVNIKAVKLKGESIIVYWKNDNHESTFKQDFLKEYDYTENHLEKTYEERKMKFSTDMSMPSISWNHVYKDQEAFYRFLLNINEKGLCLLTDVPTEHHYITKVISKIGPLTDTIYGEIWDIFAKKNPANLAYTQKRLGFHMDLSFYESPPGIQFLHCLSFDDNIEGGATFFVDIFHVVNEFRKSHAEAFDLLTRLPFTLSRIHYNRDNPVHLEFKRPIISLNHRKEVISVRWHEGEHGPAMLRQEEMEKALEAYQLFARAISAFPYKYSVRLRSGDVISFNNRRMVHGRDAFKMTKGSLRHLQGSYVNVDEFKSKLIYLSRMLGKDKPIQHVGNSDW